jgi:transcriptional regulator with XRE-family HTH domain
MSGIAIDPGRLTWHRESDDNHPIWSRQDLSDAVARLGLTDENGDPLTVTRDAIAKIENGERKPKARTVRALCEALAVGVRDLMPGGDPLVPHAGAEERKLRLAHNRDLRAFARAHGIQYRNPVSGRVYYSVPLEEAFAASVVLLRRRDPGRPGRRGPGTGRRGGRASRERHRRRHGIEELDCPCARTTPPSGRASRRSPTDPDPRGRAG